MHEDVDIVDHTVRSVLHDILGISEERLALLDEDTPQFGALFELAAARKRAPRCQGLLFRPCPRSQDIIGKRGLADQLGGCMHEDVDIVDHTVRSVLHDLLGISEERLALFDEATPLFGALPELDSMAVAGLLTELEDRLGIIIDDDDVDGDIFETLGSLIRFAKDKALG